MLLHFFYINFVNELFANEVIAYFKDSCQVVRGRNTIKIIRSVRWRPVIVSNVPRLGEQLCFALYAASNILTRAYRSLLEPLGLTYPQFVVMMALWEEDGVSITHLAACTKLGLPTMTPLLKRLEEKKLLKREASPGDDRQKLIVLTPEGSALAALGEAVTQEAFRRTGFETSEAKQLLDLCQQMIEQMESHSGKDSQPTSFRDTL